MQDVIRDHSKNDEPILAKTQKSRTQVVPYSQHSMKP